MSTLLAHFGLKRQPFARSTPKEGMLRHRGFEEALGRLRFTVELDGIAVLVADAGCGKSVLLGELAGELQQAGWVVHYFAHSTVGPFSLVNVLARKAGLTPKRSRGETAMLLTEHLVADERRHLLVLDEAHELPDDTIEDIRLLTITDFDRKSPFLLLLAGHPNLDDRLADPTHHALDQRVTTLARLAPLGLDETREYLVARLRGAGSGNRPIFDEAAVDAIFDATGGVPRRINNLATSSLIVAASRGRRLVTDQDVHDARLDRGRG